MVGYRASLRSVSFLRLVGVLGTRGKGVSPREPVMNKGQTHQSRRKERREILAALGALDQFLRSLIHTISSGEPNAQIGTPESDSCSRDFGASRGMDWEKNAREHDSEERPYSKPLKRHPMVAAVHADYVRYYHDDRTHLGLGKQTPGGRVRSAAQCHVLSHARLGGLHHRYDRVA